MALGRRTKIVATLGPATDGPEQIEALISAGVDVARVNFSHGSREEHGRRIGLVREAASKLDRPVAVLQDLPGPKIRTGALAGGEPVLLEQGREVAIASRPIVGDATRFSISHQTLPREVRPGDPILMDDGRLRLRVLATDGNEVRATVEAGGLLGERKGVHLPGVPLSLPAVTERDLEDLAFGLSQGVDYVALSFVRTAQDMHVARRWLEERSADVPLIAKLETAEAIANLESIVAASDGVMVARGDLGVELGPEQVPILQKRIVRSANRRGVPVIIATQMLESMTTTPMPTRAEAGDVANAVWEEADAVMLSGETAVGRYPIEVVQTMARIVATAEGAVPPAQTHALPRVTRPQAVSRAARSLAEDLGVALVVSFTRTGRTAYRLSQERPRVPVLAVTPEQQVYRRLALWWGVEPLVCDLAPHTEALIAQMEQAVMGRKLARRGQSVVVVGPMPLRLGVHTNFVKLHVLGRGK